MEKTFYVEINFKGETEDMHTTYFYKKFENALAKFAEEKKDWVLKHLNQVPIEENEGFDQSEKFGHFYSDMSNITNDIFELNIGRIEYEDE